MNTKYVFVTGGAVTSLGKSELQQPSFRKITKNRG